MEKVETERNLQESVVKETPVLWPYCQKDCRLPGEGNHGTESAWKKSTGKTNNSLAGQYQSMDWDDIGGSLESNGEPRALENGRP